MKYATAILSSCVFIGLASAHLGAAGIDRYAFTTIDVPDALLTGANGINETGQIVGLYVDLPAASSATAGGTARVRTGNLPGIL